MSNFLTSIPGEGNKIRTHNLWIIDHRHCQQLVQLLVLGVNFGQKFGRFGQNLDHGLQKFRVLGLLFSDGNDDVIILVLVILLGATLGLFGGNLLGGFLGLSGQQGSGIRIVIESIIL